MSGAILKPAGDLTSGVQVKGAVKQYQYDGENDATSALETITPLDSGSVKGHCQPGTYVAGAPAGSEKLTDGTVQRAAVLLCDSTPGEVGNALVSVSRLTVQGDPVAPTGSTAADGLSQAPQHE